MPDMTPLEAAEKLESLIDYAGDTLDDALEFNLRKVVDTTASYLRKIAAGEYRQVVHGHWDGGYYSENGQWYFAEVKCSVCHKASYAGKTAYCPSCGALMDGKDGKS